MMSTSFNRIISILQKEIDVRALLKKLNTRAVHKFILLFVVALGILCILKPWYIYYDPLCDVGFFLDSAKYFPVMGVPTYHYSPYYGKVVVAPCLNEPRWLFFGMLSVGGYTIGFGNAAIIFALTSWSLFFVAMYYLTSEFAGEKWALLTFPLIGTFWINVAWFPSAISEALGYPLFAFAVLLLIKRKSPLLSLVLFILSGLVRYHLLLASIPVLALFYMLDRKAIVPNIQHEKQYLFSLFAVMFTLFINDNLSLYFIGHVPYQYQLEWLVKGGGIGASYVGQSFSYGYLNSLWAYFLWVGWQAAHLMGLGFLGILVAFLRIPDKKHLTSWHNTRHLQSWVKLIVVTAIFLLFPAVLNPIQFGGYHYEFYIFGFALLGVSAVYFIKTMWNAARTRLQTNRKVGGIFLLLILSSSLLLGGVPQIQGFEEMRRIELEAHAGLRIIGDEYVKIFEKEEGDFYIMDEYPWMWFYYPPTEQYWKHFYSTWDLTFDSLTKSRYLVVYRFERMGGWQSKGIPDSLLTPARHEFYLFENEPSWRTRVVVEPHKYVEFTELIICIYKITEVERIGT